MPEQNRQHDGDKRRGPDDESPRVSDQTRARRGNDEQEDPFPYGGERSEAAHDAGLIIPDGDDRASDEQEPLGPTRRDVPRPSRD